MGLPLQPIDECPLEVKQHRDRFGFVVWDEAVRLLKNGSQVGTDSR